MMNMRNKLFYIIIVIVLTMSNVLANTDIVRADSLYVIRINIKNNHMYIYEFDQAGNISLKKDMACSPCMNQKADGLTRTITYKEEWKATNQGTYVRYANDFDGDISISSVPYKGISYDSLDANKYNLLGNSKNTINVWVSVRDAKWIYDNCQVGTQVQIDDKSEALNDDMEKAIKPEFFKKWGLNYLLSFLRFHLTEQCGNFKDQTLKKYSNPDFEKLQKVGNKIFSNGGYFRNMLFAGICGSKSL